MNNYVTYHLHSDRSLLDSCTHYKNYVDKAVELGQKAICFTEHGNIFNWVEKKLYCKEKEIKYLHGVEIYLTEKLEPKERDNYHTILIAKNYEGVKELNLLIDLSTQPDHFYYKNRISFDEFLSISNNIIKISACLASPLNRLPEDNPYLIKLLNKYDFYEIQPHQSEDQKEYNKRLYNWSKKHNKSLIVGTDTHSLNKYKAECRSILQKSKKIEYADEDKFDLTYKSYDELVKIFEQQNVLPKEIYLNAINNTNIMADTVEDFELDMSFKYPDLYDNEEDVFNKRLEKLYNEKLVNGIITNNKIYLDNIKEEKKVLKKTGMIGFMLFMSELMTWCRENGIPFGNCRGCFTSDALIPTLDGLKNINKVKMGDYVISDDGKFNKVINTYNYKINEDMIKIEHDLQGSSRFNFPSICTLDHKILVNRDGVTQYLQAKELTTNDYVCIPKIKTNDINENIIIDLSKYCGNFNYDDDFIYEKVNINKEYKYSPRWFERNNICYRSDIKRFKKGNKSKKLEYKILNNTPFHNKEEYIEYCDQQAKITRKIPRYIILDYKWNVFIGLLYGDGFTSHNTSNIGLAINNESIKDIKNKEIFYTIAKELNLDVTENVSKTKKLTQLYMASKTIHSWIKTEFFNSNKGKDKIFNKNLFNQKNESLMGLYNGLLMSDGHFGKNRICFDNTSTSLISAFYILNNILNNKPTSLLFRKGGTDNRGYNRKDSYKLSICPNKKKKLYEDKNYWFSKINNIKLIDKVSCNVYDLEVENNHSFVLNNMVVHNSVGGSTIAYILDIIDLNPIVWNTVFSRFANEDRVEIGDIDVDISPSQRELVYQYIIGRFGIDYTAYILAVGTISEKGTIDEIGRALHIKWKEENPDAKEKESPYHFQKMMNIKSEYEIDPDSTRKKYEELFYYFDGLLNTAISQSMHPAGIIASPISLPDNYGTFWNEGKRVICINMEEVHEVSLVKYDILGLKNIEIIKDTCELIGRKYPLSHEINWEDENVWKDIITSKVGIFQFESNFAYSLLKQYRPQKINDLSLVNACLRPSGESYRNKLIAREFNKNPSEQINELLKENNGFLVFQEDTIKFLQDICGLTGSEADNVRRAIGRKQRDRLEKALPQILEGYCDKSNKPREVAEEEAKEFLQIIENSADYQFGYNHSTGYSMIGYLCAYFRYYYPLEFITAYLNNAHDQKDINDGTELAKLKGIKIKQIKFGYSRINYYPDKETNSIFKGLSSIKGFGEKVDIAQELIQFKNKKYNTFVDLLIDIKENTNIGNAKLETLIKLNYFDMFGRNKKLLDIFNEFTKGKNKYEKKHKEKTKQKRIPILYEIEKSIENISLPISEQITFETELLGTPMSIYDLPKGTSFVIDLDLKNSPKLNAYGLSTGSIVQLKVLKKDFKKKPFKKGDIVQFTKFKKKPKVRFTGYNSNGKPVFEPMDGEFDFWAEEYNLVNL